MSAEGERVTAVGDRFVVHMDRESLNDYPLGEYTVNVVIARYEPDRAVAWTIDGVMQPPIGHVYGYELEPVDGGTMVTSYYDWSNIHDAYREAASSIFPVISETNLRATLGILARVVAARPGPSQARLLRSHALIAESGDERVVPVEQVRAQAGAPRCSPSSRTYSSALVWPASARSSAPLSNTAAVTSSTDRPRQCAITSIRRRRS